MLGAYSSSMTKQQLPFVASTERLERVKLDYPCAGSDRLRSRAPRQFRSLPSNQLIISGVRAALDLPRAEALSGPGFAACASVTDVVHRLWNARRFGIKHD